jgi:hypothetical protein
MSTTGRKSLSQPELTPDAEEILIVVCAHAEATSVTGNPADGHNMFEPRFDDPDGPAIRCAVCDKRLPLAHRVEPA